MQTPDIDPEAILSRPLLRQLHSFARGLFKRIYRTSVNERGKSPEDYVSEAIERYLTGEDLHDPKKSPLDYHLKWNVIRRAIFNDLPPHLKKANKPPHGLGVAPRAKDATEPSGEATLDGILHSDYRIILSELEKLISGDNVVEIIYLAITQDDFEHSDRMGICKTFGLELKEFDNGKRRLQTALTNVYNRPDLF